MDIFVKIVHLILYADRLPLVVNILLLLIVRVLLCIAVYIAARRKKLSECKSYAGVTMAFGIVGYAVFSLITSKVKSDKQKGRIGALTAVSVVLLCANLALFCGTVESADLNYKTEYYGFDFDEGVFEAENGDKIRYNNLGQGFSLHNMDAFFYEAEGGERYIYNIAKDSMDMYSSSKAYFDYETPNYCFNSEGYFYGIYSEGYDRYFKSVPINDDLKVIIDSEGELYYYIENCYFDANGDFVFTDEQLYDITYDDAVKSLQNCEEYSYDRYEYIYKNDKGLYVIYDKLGNAYSIFDYDEFMYQDKSGKVYVNPEGDFYIDKDGYIIFASNLTCVEMSLSTEDENHDEDYDGYYYIAYDSDGNLYYSPEDCYWDKNGNLKLSKYVADITYERLDEGTVIA